MHRVISVIDNERRKQGYSKRSFSQACGFGVNAYLQYTKGLQPTIGRVDTMLSVLGITYTLGERRTKNDAGDLYDS